MSIAIKQPEVDRLTSSTHEAIHIAQQQALRMYANSVAPEHLFMGIIIQGDEQALDVLGRLGMDVRVIRTQVAALSQGLDDVTVEVDTLPLSREAQACIEWTLGFISLMHRSSVFPEQLLLGVLRHPRTQPLLAFLLPDIASLQMRIAEEIGPAYTSYMDQLIQSRARDQSLVCYTRGISRRVLRKLERPTELFIDIDNLADATYALREVVAFLKATPLPQFSGSRFPGGIVLVGASLNVCRLLVRATAGEAVVPLVTVSMTALIEMVVDLHSGSVRFEDLELPVREYNLLRRGSVSEKGQRYMHALFQDVQKISPAILCIEGIDQIAKLGKHEGREALLSQLSAEMDTIADPDRTVVMAYAERLDAVDPLLLKTGRFERHLAIDENAELQPVAPKSFCVVCKRDVQPDWQYCVYCGTSLARACAHCGVPLTTLAGALFCAHCGSSLMPARS